MSCKKCNLPKTVILRNKDFYCNDCFMTSTNHKFRACLGKNKVLSPNERVLVCLSGGVGSTVLLDLIQYGISLENTKKLRIVPFFLHLYNGDKEAAELVIEQCKKYNSNVYVIPLSYYLIINPALPKANYITNVEHDADIQFGSMLNSMPPTAANDFLLRIKRTLFVKYAKILECNIVFTAETTNTLATNLLCNLATGRGSQVQNDIGFCDVRAENVKILRPMKDIGKEELDYFVTLKQLKPIYIKNINNNSLQSVISMFINDLQENFQSTISTVCKTADKIGDHNEQTQGKCLLCESDLNTKNLNMTALEASNVSKIVSFSNSQSSHSSDLSNIFDNDTCTAVFPLVHRYLCYGCSRNHSEMSQSNLPQNVQNILQP